MVRPHKHHVFKLIQAFFEYFLLCVQIGYESVLYILIFVFIIILLICIAIPLLFIFNKKRSVFIWLTVRPSLCLFNHETVCVCRCLSSYEVVCVWMFLCILCISNYMCNKRVYVCVPGTVIGWVMGFSKRRFTWGTLRGPIPVSPSGGKHRSSFRASLFPPSPSALHDLT